MKRNSNSRAFTLIELLVVIAIIAILAAILFPVFARARAQGLKASCLSNLNQIGKACRMYMDDHDGRFPQTKQTCSDPDIEDKDGGIENPDIGDYLQMIVPYSGQGNDPTLAMLHLKKLFVCPSDALYAKDAVACADPNYRGNFVTSYLINGWFIWGMKDSGVRCPASTVYLGERRSYAVPAIATINPNTGFCDDSFKPWFQPSHDTGAWDMDPYGGSIDTQRHGRAPNWTYADLHTKSVQFEQIWTYPTIDHTNPRIEW